jgi:hypothetical protein
MISVHGDGLPAASHAISLNSRFLCSGGRSRSQASADAGITP